VAERYVVAVKRESRGSVPADWHERLKALAGVRVLGLGPARAQLEVEPGALEQVRAALGPGFLIEKAIPHSFSPPLPR
jgi:hypothetical protein